SRSLLHSIFEQLGCSIQFVDTEDLDATEHALQAPAATVFLFEPISNPLIRVADVPRLIDLAHRHNVTTVVDNTFTSPYLLRPAEHGADYVVESATKYLGGHGDVMAGVVACSTERVTSLRAVRTATGGILGAFEAWLVIRGLKTLSVRLDRQCRTAIELAQFFTTHPGVTRVYFPGLPEDPHH